MGEEIDYNALRDKIIEEYRRGNVCFMTIEGVVTCPMEDFVKQPLEGILYDLNRDTATIMSFLDDPKWINDLALTSVVKYLYNRVKELDNGKQ